MQLETEVVHSFSFAGRPASSKQFRRAALNLSSKMMKFCADYETRTNQQTMKCEGSTSAHFVANCKMTRVTAVGSRAASGSFGP